MKSGSLVKNVMYRVGILLLVKILGIAARVPLFRHLGSEGAGLYQMAYAFYGLILTLLLGGLPAALSLATAQNSRYGNTLLRKLSPWLLLASGMIAVICYSLADEIAAVMGNQQLSFAVRCLSPAVAVAPALGLYRGYLQGLDRQIPIALSELTEQFIRVAIIGLSIYLLFPYGIEYLVGGALIGAFAGAAGAALLFLLLARKPIFPPAGKFRTAPDSTAVFLASSLTLALSRFIVPLSEFLDAYLIPRRLQLAGYSDVQAVSIYGELAGMGALIVYMPTLVTNVLGYTISPRLASDWAARRRERFMKRASRALRASLLWGTGAGVLLYAFAEPLSRLIFSDDSAALAIRCMSLAPAAAGLREVSMITLWASGNRRLPLYGLALGAAASVMCNYWLAANPGFGYYGAVIGMLVLEIVSACWNMWMLARKVGLRMKMI